MRVSSRFFSISYKEHQEKKYQVLYLRRHFMFFAINSSGYRHKIQNKGSQGNRNSLEAQQPLPRLHGVLRAMPATVPCAVPLQTRCASWHPVLLGSHPPRAQGMWQLYTSQFNCAGSFTSNGERLGLRPSAMFTRGTSCFLKKGRRKKLNPLAHSAAMRRSFFPWQVVGHVSFHYDFRRNTSSKKDLFVNKLAIGY